VTLSCNAKQPLEECISGSISPRSPTTSFFRSPQQQNDTPRKLDSPSLKSGSLSIICSSPNETSSRSFFPSTPDEKKNGFISSFMNESELVNLQSPKSPRRSSNLATLDESLQSRTNSPSLVMLTLTSPKAKNGNIRRKSFVFEMKSPLQRESESADELQVKINLKHVATIDEISSNEKTSTTFSFHTNDVVIRDRMKYIYGVKFKIRTKFYISPPGSNISIGNYVIVDGDRGLDMGIVVSYYSKKEFRKIGNYNQKNFQTILRLAYFSEYQSLIQKFYDEQNALSLIQSLVDSNYDMNIKVLNCEFQFDREKLVVYYKSNNKRIDFRCLVTSIWFYFRTRIWMERDETMDDVLMITNEVPLWSSVSTFSY